jgi:glycine cleavage system aminomethyltransferase T
MHASEVELGAVFFEAAGWERPHWYASNEVLLGDYGDAVQDRPHEWDARWWSPIINAEHLAMRERAGYVDLSAFSIFDIEGAGALDAVQRIAVAQLDVSPGKVVYTPVLDSRGGFRADLTIMRLREDCFRVVTGGGNGNVERKWFRDHIPGGAAATVIDRTSALSTIGLWGPHARDILGALTDADVSHGAFAFGTCRQIELDSVPVLASRISYVGELGWELYVPMESGARVWELIRAAGGPHGAIPVGIGVYGTTGRLEKGYRAHGAELDAERTIVAAGMARRKVKDAEFIGRDAYLKQRENDPESVLCTLTVDEHTGPDGTPRFMLGGEPVLAQDGAPLIDGNGRRAYVTSAGSAPSLGKHLLMSYLPPAVAVPGRALTVEYFGHRYPVSVAAADATALFDPENSRIKR